MPFQIKAVDPKQGVVSLLMHALSVDDARRQAEAQGYVILSIRQQHSWFGFGQKSAKFNVLLFCQELKALLESGLSLTEALETLSEKEQGATKSILAQINKDIHEGFTLSKALAQLPMSFPDLFVALVRASEQTGDLVEALARYVAYHTQVDKVRKRVLSASLYPALLAVVGAAVMLFLLAYVVPRFSLIYADLRGDLPFLSRILMSWGALLNARGKELSILLTSLIASAVYGFGRRDMRARILSLVWRLPAIGDRMRVYQLARLYRTLGMLQRAGIPLVQALNMTADLLQSALRARLTQCRQRIQEGWSFSSAIEATTLATPVALRLITVGERSGQLGAMLEHVAQFHDEELARWFDDFLRLFEPILMIFIGALIGTVVVLMYMPIFELADSLQ